MHTAPLPGFRPTRRFYLGLGISVALHAAVMLNISPASYRHAPVLPFTVEIQPRHSDQPAAAPLSETVPTDLAAVAPEPVPAVVEPTPTQTAPKEVYAPREESSPREESHTATAVPEKMVGFSAPQDKYFTLAEIDVRPQPVNEVDLIYPKRAYAMRTRGKVLLTIFISEEGAVDDVKIIEATPAGVFEEAALTATLALRFSPGMRYGQRVKSQKTIEVVFDPYESIRTP